MYAIHFALIGAFSLWAFIQLKPWLGHVPAMAAVAPPTILVSLGSALILTRWVDQPSVRLANRIGRYTQERVVPALASRWQRLRGAA
jgi:hypothetical protein